MADKIKVLIVDDHPVFRFGLRSMLVLDPTIEVTGEAENAASALLAIEQKRADIVLVDIRMPGPSGISLAQQLHSSHPEIKVMILTAFEDDDYLIKALAAGVYAYLYKNSSNEILVKAIHLVYDGQKLLNPDQTNLVLNELEEQKQKEKIDRYQLSDMEIKILSSISHGETYEEISKMFFLSEPTVKRMVANILTKLEANNRAQAVAIAIRDGLI
jgi:DNA-binding NarL/FixJ family response regulator